MGLVESLVPLLLSLGKIAAEYATANAAQRADLIAQADAEYAACRDRILGLAQVIIENDAAADAAADAKDAPNPTVLVNPDDTKP